MLSPWLTTAIIAALALLVIADVATGALSWILG
jgi:hypothetical protein